MLVKGSMVTQMSGSLGGITAARNKGGQYFRARSVPVNPASAQQVAVRNAFTALVVAWLSTLTQAQRDAWDVYAANVPITGPLGDSINLSGQNWYISANTPRLQASVPRVDAAPTTFDRGPQDDTIVVSASEATQLVSIAFDNTLPWANDDDGAMLVYVSRPQNVSINFFAGPYRLAGEVSGNTTTAPTSPQTIAAPFPFVAGQKLFVAIALSQADGRLTTRSRFQLNAAA